LREASNSTLSVVKMEIFSLQPLLFFYAVNANLAMAKRHTTLSPHGERASAHSFVLVRDDSALLPGAHNSEI